MARYSKFMLGGLVGAAIGMLFAPKSGRELRQSLMGGGPHALPPTSHEPSAEQAGVQARSTVETEPEQAVTFGERLEESRRQVEEELSEAIPEPPPVEEKPPAGAGVEEELEVEEAEAPVAGPIHAVESEGVEPFPEIQSEDLKPPIDRDEMRQRIEETRSRLKAKAFDSMVEGETLIATGDDSVPLGGTGEKTELDEETGEMIDQILEEED